MDSSENSRTLKSRMKLVIIVWSIIIPLMIGIILYSRYESDKKELLVCSKKQSNIEIILTYNYTGGYFLSGNMKVVVDSLSHSETQANEMNWCDFMKEQSQGLFIAKSCNEENAGSKKTINMDIGFDSSIDRKNIKIKDDKQKIEELGFSCNIE